MSDNLRATFVPDDETLDLVPTSKLVNAIVRRSEVAIIFAQPANSKDQTILACWPKANIQSHVAAIRRVADMLADSEMGTK